MIWHKHYFLCALSCVFWAAKSTQYKDLSYYSVNAALDTLKGHFASISNANEQYGLSFSKEVPAEFLYNYAFVLKVSYL